MERSPQVYVKPSSGVTSNDRGWEDFRENDVPCHHLPAGMQKKIHLADKVDSRQAKEIGFMNTHLPIARRSNGMTKTGSSPDSASSLLQPSQYPQ